ncbi:predicted protein [Uncinocarpus reesii 1704]|uniref:60S acidic ribosomal protein P0 n=1 Tax=Uncinocarpus reesii (strain UAMH 1704) TaxID=336963 RepID=C4JJY9_UNCRE|nr:uncharacterized protein UREG_01946 [Uncinocarpus reesii 1704]EEP77097.1 predicted protein [Uncinocarpus reesii 1704]
MRREASQSLSDGGATHDAISAGARATFRHGLSEAKFAHNPRDSENQTALEDRPVDNLFPTTFFRLNPQTTTSKDTFEHQSPLVALEGKDVKDLLTNVGSAGAAAAAPAGGAPGGGAAATEATPAAEEKKEEEEESDEDMGFGLFD